MWNSIKTFFCRIWKWFRLNFDRSFSSTSGRQVLWLIGVAAMFILAGWLILVLCNKGQPGPSFWKSMAYFFDTDSMHIDLGTHIHGMKVPRVVSLVFTFLGMAVMSGLLISVIVNMLTKRSDDFQRGYVRYGFSGHVVILGSGDSITNITRDFCRELPVKKRDIVIMTSSDVLVLREKLATCLSRKERRRVTLIYGRRDSECDLRKIRVSHAHAVYVAGEDKEPEHDAVNIKALELIRDICAEDDRPSVLPCSVMFEYQSTITIVQYAGYKKSLTKKRGRAVLELNVSNFYENWSQNVFVSNAAAGITYEPLDRGEGIGENSTQYVHLVVAGMTRMGYAMAETAAQIAHFPNFGKGRRTLITFIDPQAKQEMDFFRGRHESLFELSRYSLTRYDKKTGKESVEKFAPAVSGKDFLDIEWQFIEGGVEMPQIRKMLTTWSEEPDRILTIVISGESSPANVAASLYLPQAVYDAKVPVLVYQSEDGSLTDTVRNSGKYEALRPFGMTADLFDPGVKVRIERAKRVNYIYDHMNKTQTFATEMAGRDTLDSLWNDLSLPLQWSNIYMANTIATKYRSLGIKDMSKAAAHVFSEEEIEMLARVEHRRWNMEKLLLGYRPVNEDEARKIAEDKKLKNFYKEEYFAHYDLRPFEDLQVDAEGNSAGDYDRCIIDGFKLILGQ